MFNTQNYNKYGYVMNNPLMYNDPSGEAFFAFLGLGAFWKAVIIGAAVGLASYSLGVAITGQQWSLGGALKATFFGALGGAATFGIGGIFSSCSGSLTVFEHLAKSLGDFGAMLVQGGVHAISQGVMSLMQGDSFISGAAGGFFGSLGASAWGSAVGSKFAGSTVGTIAFGALSGGVGAELTGGNFWQGALTGGIVAGLNHAMHKMDTPLYDSLDQEDPPGRKTGVNIPKPDARSLIEAGYNTEGKNWELKNGRYTITTKKQILQWSPEGEVEVYNKGTKQHLGGFNPKDATHRTGKIDVGRVPNGGWKVSTSKMLKVGGKILNFIDKIDRATVIFDFFPAWMIPYQTGTVKYQPGTL